VGYREDVAQFWDAHVAGWLDGADAMDDSLECWFLSYQGEGSGLVSRDGLTEPYHGDLLGEPKAVVLGLNPGRYHPEFQSRAGIFAGEIRSCGSYTAWATTGPYVRPPWTDRMGRNRYFAARLGFAGRLADIEDPQPNDLLVFELYPWHSIKVTARMRPPSELIERFVWQPISELDVSHVFAFGREWDHLASGLRLPQVAALGSGGLDYGSTVATRAVRIYRLRSGQHLVVEWHSGSAGPPGLQETVLLRDAVQRSTPVVRN
jgi:hypothetical protein